MACARCCCLHCIKLVHQVQQEGLQGAALLQLLHNRAHCGTPELASCSGRLLWHCNQDHAGAGLCLVGLLTCPSRVSPPLYEPLQLEKDDTGAWHAQ